MHLERLSSSSTFLWKYIFAPVWCSVFGLVVLRTFTSPDVGDRQLRWLFLAAWFAGSALVWLLAGRLKKVQLDGDELVISNYLREVRVPVQEIVAVNQQWDSNRTITVRFANKTPFGSTITFSPVSPRPVFATHPLVGRLRGLSGHPGTSA